MHNLLLETRMTSHKFIKGKWDHVSSEHIRITAGKAGLRTYPPHWIEERVSFPYPDPIKRTHSIMMSSAIHMSRDQEAENSLPSLNLSSAWFVQSSQPTVPLSSCLNLPSGHQLTYLSGTGPVLCLYGFHGGMTHFCSSPHL